MSTLNQKSKDISAIVRPLLTGNGEDGVFTPADGAFEATLPEGLTMSQFELAQEHRANVIAGTVHAFGEVSLELSKKNKKLEATSLILPMGMDKLELGIAREEIVPNRTWNKEENKFVTDGTKSAWGTVSHKLVIHGNKGSIGQLKAAKEITSDAYADAFSS